MDTIIKLTPTTQNTIDPSLIDNIHSNAQQYRKNNKMQHLKTKKRQKVGLN